MVKYQCVHIVFNEFTFDSRVKKISKVSSETMLTTVFCFSETNKTYFLDSDSYQVKKIGLWFRHWRFFPHLRHILAYLEFLFKFICSLEFRKLRVIHVHDMKPMAIALIVKFMTLGKVSIVYDCHEYETETDDLNGKEFKKNLLKFYESFLVRVASKVITVSPKISQEYSRLYKIPAPIVILNCPSYCSPGPKKDIFRQKYNIPSDKKIFLYQGAIVRGRGVEETIKAFQSGIDDVVVFMGFGELQDKVIDASADSDHIFFHEAVSPTVLIDFTSSADFGICFIPNICLSYDFSLPNKIFEYAQARLPMIVNNLSEIRRFVSQNQIGVVIEKDDSESIKQAVKLASLMDVKQMIISLDDTAINYNWENESGKLKEIYYSLLN